MTQREIGNLEPLPRREGLEAKLTQLAGRTPLSVSAQKDAVIEAAVSSAFMFSDDTTENDKAAITRKLKASKITKPKVVDL